MSKWLEAAKRATEPEEMQTPQPEPQTVLSVKSVLSEGERQKPVRADRADPEAFQHGVSVAGSPKTWTGRIVSLEEWRHLTEWEKHGQNGRHWNGIARRWEPPGTS